MYELSAAEQIFAQGETKGKTESIMAVLQARGFTISPKLEKQIKETKEDKELNTLIIHAATITSIDHLFSPPTSTSIKSLKKSPKKKST